MSSNFVAMLSWQNLIVVRDLLVPDTTSKLASLFFVGILVFIGKCVLYYKYVHG